jgi:hypothetical protein
VREEPEQVLTKLLSRLFRLILWYSGQKNKFLKIICIFVLIHGAAPSFTNYDVFKIPEIGGRCLAPPFPSAASAHSIAPI